MTLSFGPLFAWALALSGAADAASSAGAEPPKALVCLARHYGVRAVQEGPEWFVQVPEGGRIRFDDGERKSFDQLLDRPDLQDMFSLPYPTGPLQPVLSENQDPGRIRVEALFDAVYGGGRRAMRSAKFLGRPIVVHERALPAFAAVEKRLQALLAVKPELKAQVLPLGGTFVARKIAGTDRASAHSWGIAIDVNPARSDYWRWRRGTGWQHGPAQAIVDAFEAEGFIWGGRWYHFDTMHFEYRPELLDPTCLTTTR